MVDAELGARRTRTTTSSRARTRASTPTRRASCASITTSARTTASSARYGHNGRRETRAKSGRAEDALTAGYHHRWNNVFSVDLTSTLTPTLLSSARGGLDASPPSRHQRRRGPRRLRPGVARLPEHVHQRDSAAVPADPHHRLRRRVDRPGRRTGRPERRLLRSETLTKMLGRHQLKFGGEFRYGISTWRTRSAASTSANLQFTPQLHVAASDRRQR